MLMRVNPERCSRELIEAEILRDRIPFRQPDDPAAPECQVDEYLVLAVVLALSVGAIVCAIIWGIFGT